jgi:pectate lyase
MKQATINVPRGGRVLIIGPKDKIDNGQQDAFVSFRESWFESMLAHINQRHTKVRMSEIRVEANIYKLPAPLDKNWWGLLGQKMRAFGWKIVGYDRSPIKSRAGGTEAIWERAA